MPDYILCPVCHNPALKDEPCGVCAARAKEAASAAPASPVAPISPEVAAQQYNDLFASAPVSPAPAPTAAPDATEYRRLMDATYAPMGAWNVFGTLLLFCVPLIGFIFAVIFACGGCRKKQKASLARGYLLFVLFGLLLSALIGAVVFWFFASNGLEFPMLVFPVRSFVG
ncbi:MAG: hypothetical protein IJF24_05165 [Clostridia bacterium]|nr:hypothetical protein [Clostridia bacterium]